MYESIETNEYSILQNFMVQTFSSYLEMNALFKNDTGQDVAKLVDPEIKLELLDAVNDIIEELVSSIFIHFS